MFWDYCHTCTIVPVLSNLMNNGAKRNPEVFARRKREEGEKVRESVTKRNDNRRTERRLKYLNPHFFTRIVVLVLLLL